MPILSDDNTAGVYNIITSQGKTFKRTITWTDSAGVAVNITGYTALMKVRKLYPATRTTVATYGPAVLDLSVGSGITLTTPASGILDIEVDATTMAGITSDIYNYDLELISGAGEVYEILRGTFTVRPEATF